MYGSGFAGGAAQAGVVDRLDPAAGADAVLSSFQVGKTVVAARPLGGLVVGRGSVSGGTAMLPKSALRPRAGGRLGLPYLVGGKSELTIFDQPLFKPPLFDPADQADPRRSQTWRGSARVFVICNCATVFPVHRSAHRDAPRI